MKNERTGDWQNLCRAIVMETDSKKLSKLIQQLNAALDRKPASEILGADPAPKPELARTVEKSQHEA
jgi:hypothetical protein